MREEEGGVGVALHELGRALPYMKRRFLPPTLYHKCSLASIDQSINQSIHASIQPQYAVRRTPPASSSLDTICIGVYTRCHPLHAIACLYSLGGGGSGGCT